MKQITIAVISAGIGASAGYIANTKTHTEYAHNPSTRHYCRNLHETSKDPALKSQGEEDAKKCRKQEGWE